MGLAPTVATSIWSSKTHEASRPGFARRGPELSAFSERRLEAFALGVAGLRPGHSISHSEKADSRILAGRRPAEST